MPRYEYKVVPAPQKGTKARGVKTAEGRFALSVEELLNRMGTDGWEYQRAELLPSEERSGLTGSVTNWRNVLIFRRRVEIGMPEFSTATDDSAGAELDPKIRPIPGPDEIARLAPISALTQDPPMSAAPEPVETADSSEDAAEPGDDSEDGRDVIAFRKTPPLVPDPDEDDVRG